MVGHNIKKEREKAEISVFSRSFFHTSCQYDARSRHNQRPESPIASLHMLCRSFHLSPYFRIDILQKVTALIVPDQRSV